MEAAAVGIFVPSLPSKLVSAPCQPQNENSFMLSSSPISEQNQVTHSHMIRKVVWACLTSLNYHDQIFSLHCQIARVHSVSGLILNICNAFNRAMALMPQLKLVREEKQWQYLLVPHFQL